MSDRKKAIERLRAVKLAAGMSSHEMLSAIGRAVLPDAVAWVPYSCDGLRNEIVELLEDADAEIDAVRHECERRIERVVEESMVQPRDMDGNVIHVGDIVTCKFICGKFEKSVPLPIDHFVYTSEGWRFCTFHMLDDNAYSFPCDEVRITNREDER